MIKEFVPYEEAVDLKELEFDEPCIGFFKDTNKVKAVDQHWGSSIRGISKKTGYKIDDLVLAPTFSQAFQWFREKHKMIFNLTSSTYYYPSIAFINTDGNSQIELGEFNSYEEAELACLKKLIEIVKNK